MMTTTHTITAPSGAVLRINDTDLRRGWTDPRGRIPGMEAKKLIVGTSIEGLCGRGVFLTAAFTEEDRAIWERERRHAVPVQSFRIKTSTTMTTSISKSALTDPESLPALLQRIKTLADPEMPMRYSPSGVQRRMERIRERLDIAINTLNQNGPRPGLHMSLPLAKELIRLVKEAELGAAYGKDVTAQLNSLRHVLMAEAGLEPKEDGWGHAHEDDSVESLFREWAATEAGTDRHEQLFKQIMERGADQLQVHQLLGQINDLKTQMFQVKAAQGFSRKHLAKLEEFIKGEIDGLRRELLDPKPGPTPCPPEGGIIFTPCPTETFDKAVTEVAGLDSSCESPRVRWEESAPEPPMEDTPEPPMEDTPEPPMEDTRRAEEEFD